MIRLTTNPASSFPNSSEPAPPSPQRSAAAAFGLGDQPLTAIALIAGIMFVIFSAVVFLVGDRSAALDHSGRQQVPLPTASAVFGGIVTD